MHFSYTNHVVVQNIYIYTSRREGQHKRTDGELTMNIKTTSTMSSGKERQKTLWLRSSLLYLNQIPPPLVNKTLHLFCKHQCRVEVLHVREQIEYGVEIMNETRSQFLAACASAWGHKFSAQFQEAVFFSVPMTGRLQKVEQICSTSHTFQAGIEPNGNCRQPVCTHFYHRYICGTLHQNYEEKEKKNEYIYMVAKFFCCLFLIADSSDMLNTPTHTHTCTRIVSWL